MVILHGRDLLSLAEYAEVHEGLAGAVLVDDLVDFDRQGVQGEEEVDHLGEEGLGELRHTRNVQEVVQQSQVPKLDDPQNKERAVDGVLVYEDLFNNISYLLNIRLHFSEDRGLSCCQLV